MPGDDRKDQASSDEQANVSRCPICSRPREKAFAPFCSRRCADVDLSRWMTGSYAIAGEPVDGEEDHHS